MHPTPLAFTPFGLVMEGYRSTPGRGVAPAVEIGVNRGRDPIDVIAAWQSDVPAAYHPAEVAALLPQGDG